MAKGRTALVVFSGEVSSGNYDEVISGERLNEFEDGGSIYEATELIRELSQITLPDGKRLPKSFIYKGFEIWWFRYGGMFYQSCLPYTQYRRLLEHLSQFSQVDLLNPSSMSLFSTYLEAHGVKVRKLNHGIRWGVLIQGVISLISLPLLIIMRRRLVLFIGDKFEKGTDHDFRMRYIYEELRRRKIKFTEFIRSLESTKKVLSHALFRKRPAIYSEAVFMLGQFLSWVTGSRKIGHQRFGSYLFENLPPRERFKALLATQYLVNAYDDVWAARIMSWLFWISGTRAVYVTTVMERTFHAFLGAKLNNLPTVGILHGVASPYYNGYEFLPGFDGERQLTVDRYGVWSEWWKELFLEKGDAYKEGQLEAVGLMRPLKKDGEMKAVSDGAVKKQGPIKVLLVPGELSAPKEILPYISTLMKAEDISFHITFRPYRDGFETWIRKNHPEILEEIGQDKILLGSIHSAIAECDVVVGAYSTAVIEALLQLKPALTFETHKWGDYFSLKDYRSGEFFALDPEDLVKKIKSAIQTSPEVLKDLQERFFGDPYKNGSEWVVEELAKHLG